MLPAEFLGDEWRRRQARNDQTGSRSTSSASRPGIETKTSCLATSRLTAPHLPHDQSLFHLCRDCGGSARPLLSFFASQSGTNEFATTGHLRHARAIKSI